jgi:hypothetical protein
MHVTIGYHRPLPGSEHLVIDSMHRFGKAMIGKPGFRQAFVLQNKKRGELIGVAIWDSQDAMQAARPDLDKAIAGDDFDSWERESPHAHDYDVVWTYGELGSV